MKISTTDGKEYYNIDMCSHCSLDTAGNHEPNCPLYRKENENNTYLPLILEQALTDIQNIVGNRLKHWNESNHEAEKLLFKS